MDYDYDCDDDPFDVSDYGDDFDDGGGWDDDHSLYNSDDDYQPQVLEDDAESEQPEPEAEEQIVEEVEGDDEQYDDEDEDEVVVQVDEQYDGEDELLPEEEEEEHEDLEVEEEVEEEEDQEYEEDEESEEEHQEDDVDDLEEEEDDDDDGDYYDDDDDYGFRHYIPFTSAFRGSSNPGLGNMPIGNEERLQHQAPPPPPPPPPREQSLQQNQQQHQEQVQRRETVAIPQITENVVGVDERRAEENDQRRREEGEIGESASSTMKGIESEGTSKRGESIGNMADGGCCSICMEPWSSEGDHQVSCLPCGHVYGLSCIKTWVQRSTYSKCPQCNRVCRLEDIITLYVSRLAVSDGEQQKKILSLQAENEFLKMKSKGEWEELNRIIGKMNTDHEEKNKRLSEQVDEMRKLIKRICDEGLKRQDE